MINLRLFFLLALVISVGYWRILQIYPTHSDWDVFFNIAHPSSNIWTFTPEDLAQSVYRHFTFPINIFFPILKFNMPAYFLIGLFTYFLSAIFFYFFLLEVTKNKYLSSIISVLYASLGYYSWETLGSIEGLNQMFGMLLFSFLILTLLIKHFRSGKNWQYIFALILFAFVSEYYILRTHGLFIVLFIFLLFNSFENFKKNKNKLLIFTLKLLPFAFIYRLEYSQSSTLALSEVINIFKNNISELFFLTSFPVTFSNSLLPGNIFGFVQNYQNIFSSNKFMVSVGFGNLQVSWTISGVLIFAFLIYLVKREWRKNEAVSKLLLFSISWFFAQQLGYFMGFADDNFKASIFQTGTRYIAPQIVTASIIFGCLIFILHKKMQIILLFLVILITLTASNLKLLEISKETNFKKIILEKIKSQIQVLPQKPVIFVEYSKTTPFYTSKRYEHPNIGFQIFHEIPELVTEENSLEELLEKVESGKVNLNSLLTFYVNGGYVKNTTKETKAYYLSKSYKKETSTKPICPADIKFSWKDKTLKNYITTSSYGLTSEWPTNLSAWITNHHEEVLIDQKGIKETSEVIWTNNFKQTSPADYEFFASNYKNSWIKVLSIKDGPLRKEKEIVHDTFPKKINARYIKMVITRTHSGFSPSIPDICPSN